MLARPLIVIVIVVAAGLFDNDADTTHDVCPNDNRNCRDRVWLGNRGLPLSALLLLLLAILLLLLLLFLGLTAAQGWRRLLGFSGDLGLRSTSSDCLARRWLGCWCLTRARPTASLTFTFPEKSNTP